MFPSLGADHAGSGAQRLDRERQGQDPRQGGHPPRSATFNLCRQAAGRWPHAVGLQHPEGEHAALGAAPARRHANLRQDVDWQDGSYFILFSFPFLFYFLIWEIWWACIYKI